ncbi:GNAT family N-acetyltransferase [Paracoccus pacificus]|uniref:GNAT family N-acetyltransferase n=1 Tax=Paracoccus pacificus TaxID=1463598 RepID=A0ABW4R4C1_9RHOB
MRGQVYIVDGTFGPVDPEAAKRIAAILPGHAETTRNEPGCIGFSAEPAGDDANWRVDEAFADSEAFAHHQERISGNHWGQATAGIRRDYNARLADPVIRPEVAADLPGIRSLVTRAFPTDAEARIVDKLRADGDLVHSLVAMAGAHVAGHVGLSRVRAPVPALCLAPVSVHPALQGRGLGSDLVRAALDAAQGSVVVVVGDPVFYGRFGFQHVGWESRYAGPYQMALDLIGAPLPDKATLTYPPAFAIG